jgi:HEAT repeat protein
VGLARIGAAGDVAAIQAMLADGSLLVRESAILALGATGDEAAVAPLCALAQGANDVSPIARPLAFVALGVGRRLGMSAATDLRVQRILNEDPGDEDLQLGALLYKELAGASNLDLRARTMAADEKLSSAVRCRALEALGGSFEDEALATLLDEVSGRDVVRRRSAAMGLSELDSSLALAPLCNAFELESEMTTRSLILMAIGEHGGGEARRFLEKTMRRGPQQQRAWAALALGLATRGETAEVKRAIGLSLRESNFADLSRVSTIFMLSRIVDSSV